MKTNIKLIKILSITVIVIPIVIGVIALIGYFDKSKLLILFAIIETLIFGWLIVLLGIDMFIEDSVIFK